MTHALVEAIREDNFDLVHMLVVDLGAKVNGKKGLSMTPLAFAKSLKRTNRNADYIIGFLQREGAAAE